MDECNEIKEKTIFNIEEIVNIRNKVIKNKDELENINNEINKKLMEEEDVSDLIIKKFKVVDKLLNREVILENKLNEFNINRKNFELCVLRKI